MMHVGGWETPAPSSCRMALVHVNWVLVVLDWFMLARTAARYGEEIIEVVLGRAAAHPLLGSLVEYWRLRVVYAAPLGVSLNQVVGLAGVMLTPCVSWRQLRWPLWLRFRCRRCRLDILLWCRLPV